MLGGWVGVVGSFIKGLFTERRELAWDGNAHLGQEQLGDFHLHKTEGVQEGDAQDWGDGCSSRPLVEDRGSYDHSQLVHSHWPGSTLKPLNEEVIQVRSSKTQMGERSWVSGSKGEKQPACKGWGKGLGFPHPTKAHGGH